MNSDLYPNETRYKTAQATIACAHFKAGDFVTVEFSHHDTSGQAWFLIRESQNGPLKNVVSYPKKHLTRFTF